METDRRAGARTTLLSAALSAAISAALSAAIYILSGVIGVAAFLYPFFLDTQPAGAPGLAAGHRQDAPFVTAALVGLALIALWVELRGQTVGAKTVALLGILVAITSVLRFIDVAIPLPGGFSPVFAPVILAGYVFGGRFGFLMGAFTMLVSALITGGVGPWLPYQMFTTGWVGMTAGWLGRVAGGERGDACILLSGFGFAWGILYGVIINLYFWPFVAGPVGQSWTPGAGLGESAARYAAFYIATSLWWDLMGALGNAALILLLGAPVLRIFARFHRRFHFEAETVYV